MTPTTNATVLAFDFGTRRIGVAVGNTLTRLAQPLLTIAAHSDATVMTAIAALVEQWQPRELIVGLPLHADGTPHTMTANADRFALALGDRFGLPVVRVDERWTTETAQDQLNRERRGREGRAHRDEIAAQLILQAYFDERTGNAGAP
ncbi:MAG TPA: Holliday junction resolvase RuvX [Casimicrobiaceae bacterium]|jgi:putative Holliday junction resolvase